MKLKLLLGLSLILVMTSCGHNKIRKVRVNKNKSTIVSTSKSDQPEGEKRIVISPVEGTSNSIATPEYTLDEEVPRVYNDVAAPSISPLASCQPQDSTDVKQPKISQDAYDESQESEENARTASTFFVLSLVIFILGPLGLVFFIIANRKYKKAKRARFTTPEGEQFERRAKVIKIIISSIFLGFAALGCIALLFIEPIGSLAIAIGVLVFIGIVALCSNIFLG
jgi:hypothetical protein